MARLRALRTLWRMVRYLRAGFVCRSLPFNTHQGILAARKPLGLSRLLPAQWAGA